MEDMNVQVAECAGRFYQVLGPHSAALGASQQAQCRRRHVALYASCQLLRGSWIPPPNAFMARAMGKERLEKDAERATNRFFLQLDAKQREPSKNYHRDDLWVVSSAPASFAASPSSTEEANIFFFARAVYHGPAQNGRLELEPFGTAASAVTRLKQRLQPGKTAVVNAIRLGSYGSTVQMLDNLAHLHCRDAPLPLLPLLLGQSSMAPSLPLALSTRRTTAVTATSTTTTLRFPLPVTAEEIGALVEETVQRHSLNEHQAAVLRACIAWSTEGAAIHLVHGVFGSGKSFLLVILIIFLCRLSERYSLDLRILVSAGTNTAVDRTLLPAI